MAQPWDCSASVEHGTKLQRAAARACAKLAGLLDNDFEHIRLARAEVSLQLLLERFSHQVIKPTQMLLEHQNVQQSLQAKHWSSTVAAAAVCLPVLSAVLLVASLSVPILPVTVTPAFLFLPRSISVPVPAAVAWGLLWLSAVPPHIQLMNRTGCSDECWGRCCS